MTDEERKELQWNIRTLEQAYQERPPTEYVVDGFFATESLVMTFGAPGSYKSMLMADVACHVVQGTDWLPGVAGKGGAGIPTKQSPVFWLDLDNGTRRTDERFGAIARALGLNEDDPLYYVSIPTNPVFSANDLEAVLTLRDYINYFQAKLVIIDNLSLITGAVEENSAEMAIIMGNLRVLAERTGACFVIIHHQRKGGAGASRAGDALRGHSSIEANLDLAIHVAREPNSLEVTLQSTKTRGVDVPTVTARFNFEHRSGTKDLQTAWFDGKPIVAGTNPVRLMILKVVHDSPGGQITKGRLADEVYDRLNQQHGINRIRNWIGEMIEVTGELKVTVGDFNRKLISINNEEKCFTNLL